MKRTFRSATGISINWQLTLEYVIHIHILLLMSTSKVCGCFKTKTCYSAIFTLPIVTKDDFSFPSPCLLCPAIFYLIMLWPHLCAHGNCSRCGLFHPLSTSPAISGPWWVNTGMTGHELHDYRQLKGCWLHILHIIIIPTINHAPLAVEFKIVCLVEMGVLIEIKP